MSEELKPCPFGCATEDAAGPALAYIPSVVRSEGGAVQCRNCGCDGPWCATEAEAIAAWNQRTSDDELTRLRTLLERARDTLKELNILRSGCSPDELGAVYGNRVSAFVIEYRATLAEIEQEMG